VEPLPKEIFRGDTPLPPTTTREVAIAPGPLQVVHLSAPIGSWRLSSAPPAPALADAVLEYWEVEGALIPFRETLLPNGATEVMVNLGPRHRLHWPSRVETWERSWLSGLHEHSLIIESADGTHLVSARLRPLGAARLLGPCVPAAANSVVDLEALFGPDAAALRAALLAADGPAARFALLERWLLGRSTPEESVPEFVRLAVARIDEAHGRLAIARLHLELGVSRKHLAVAVRRHLGIPAKAYARIRRFVWTLDRLRETESPDWPRLASEAGYSDQSHLVRDFRRIGAASPTDYLRRRTPDGTALIDSPR
jgi:AraC-like DNA-binding protein